jgi:aldose 1-epimerase
MYTGAYLDGSLTGKAGLAYQRYAGICLECHGYPDGPNAPHCGNIILRPGQVQHHITAYAFSTAS